MKRIICALSMLMLCFMCAAPAHAAATPDFGEKGSLDLVMEYGANKIPIRGAGLTLYKVAELGVSADGKSLSYDITTGPFAGATALSAYLEDLTTENNLAAAVLLRDFAATHNIAGTATRTTGENGVASFGDLEAALYLVAQTGSVGGYYDLNPFLLSVPMGNADGTDWEYNIMSAPKTQIVPRPSGPYYPPTVDPPPVDPPPVDPPPVDPPPEDPPPVVNPPSSGPGDPPPMIFDEDGVPLGEWRYDPELGEWVFDEFPPLADLPQTGQLRWPIPVLALSGMILFVLGWATYRKKDSAEEQSGF
jgi:hypothetical protein